MTGQQRVVASETTFCGGEFYDGHGFFGRGPPGGRACTCAGSGSAPSTTTSTCRQGDFVTRLVRLNLDVAFNIAWSWENFLQYDNVSDTIGVNSILRWIPKAGRETVLAVNSQQEDFDRDGRFRSYTADATLKLSYTFRY